MLERLGRAFMIVAGLIILFVLISAWGSASYWTLFVKAVKNLNLFSPEFKAASILVTLYTVLPLVTMFGCINSFYSKKGYLITFVVAALNLLLVILSLLSPKIKELFASIGGRDVFLWVGVFVATLGGALAAFGPKKASAAPAK